MKEEHKKRKGTFLTISDFIDKHLRCVVFIIIIAAIIFPLLVTCLYSCKKPLIIPDISADALLTYLGSIFGWCIALVTAAITLFQARKVQEMGIQAMEDSRKTEIKPSITLIVEQGDDPGTFEFYFYNSSNYDAIGIYMFDTALFPLLKRQDDRHKNLVFGDGIHSGKAISVGLADDRLLSENGLPKTIELFYFDIDHNLITETFRSYKDGHSIGYEYVTHVYE